MQQYFPLICSQELMCHENHCGVVSIESAQFARAPSVYWVLVRQQTLGNHLIRTWWRELSFSGILIPPVLFLLIGWSRHLLLKVRTDVTHFHPVGFCAGRNFKL